MPDDTTVFMRLLDLALEVREMEKGDDRSALEHKLYKRTAEVEGLVEKNRQLEVSIRRYEELLSEARDERNKANETVREATAALAEMRSSREIDHLGELQDHLTRIFGKKWRHWNVEDIGIAAAAIFGVTNGPDGQWTRESLRALGAETKRPEADMLPVPEPPTNLGPSAEALTTTDSVLHAIRAEVITWKGIESGRVITAEDDQWLHLTTQAVATAIVTGDRTHEPPDPRAYRHLQYRVVVELMPSAPTRETSS